MKIMKKSFIILLCVLLSIVFVSCEANNNVFLDENYYTKDGELTISPYFAYYNNGKTVKELEDIDPEIYKEGVSEDGSLNIYFAVCNNTSFDRKINEIRVGFIQTADEYDIVEPSEFTLDNETYIAAGQSLIIPCVFEKEFVKLEAKLDEIIAQASVVYEGCVLSAKNTSDYKKGKMNYFVDELKFTQANGIEGSFSIVNESDKDEYFGTVEINFYADSKDKKINKIPLVMEINSTVKSTEKITLNYAILADNVNEEIIETKLFDIALIEIIKE